jgi:acyl carrier protein
MTRQINEILLDIKPDIDIECKEFVSAGELDSFDIVMLVQRLEATFDLRIPASRILLENFESVEDIARLIQTIQSGLDR